MIVISFENPCRDSCFTCVLTLYFMEHNTHRFTRLPGKLSEKLEILNQIILNVRAVAPVILASSETSLYALAPTAIFNCVPVPLALTSLLVYIHHTGGLEPLDRGSVVGGREREGRQGM